MEDHRTPTCHSQVSVNWFTLAEAECLLRAISHLQLAPCQPSSNAATVVWEVCTQTDVSTSVEANALDLL